MLYHRDPQRAGVVDSILGMLPQEAPPMVTQSGTSLGTAMKGLCRWNEGY